MAYKIVNLNVHTSPSSGDIYFFDANIWLLLLGIQPNLKQHEIRYINYFKSVAQSDCVIMLPALLVSEVVNRMIKYEMFRYANKKGDRADDTYFKQKYRHTPDCKKALQQIYDDISIYASSCSLTNDKFGEKGFKHSDLLITTGPILEFNDHYLYLLAKDTNAKIVTHDQDFLIDGSEICTLNQQMIQNSR